MLDHRIDTFLKLCEIRNYTRTAEILSVTQPAVTQHIKFLEQYYGGKLFFYTGKNLELTDKGEILRKNAMTMKVNSEKLKYMISQEKSNKKEIKFGATLTIGEYYMPKVLSKLINAHPEYQMKMYVENTHNLLNKLQHGEIDFALLEGIFDKHKYETRLVSNEEFICVASPSFNKQSKQPYELKQLFEKRLILREKGSGTREILEQLLLEKNTTIEDFADILELGNMNVIKALTEEDIGITFLYRIAAEKDISDGKLVQLEIKDFAPKREFNFVFLKNSLFKQSYNDIYEKIIT
ncbi:MAG: LysR family transcriptional regulator [Proteocatella sp.]